MAWRRRYKIVVTQLNFAAVDRPIRRPWTQLGCLLGALVSVLVWPAASHAQVDSREGIALQNQIYQLKQDIQSLRGASDRGGYGGGGGGSNDAAAQLLSRVQAMEEQVRQLRGRIDETQNLITRQNADLSKRIDDLTFQLNLQQGRSGSATPPGSGGTLQGAAPPPVREVAPRPAPDTPRQESTPVLTGIPQLPMVIPPPRQPPQSFTFNQVPDPTRPVPRPPEPAARPAPPPQDDDQEPPAAQTASAQTPLALAGKRTPEIALQEGHAALARRDYAGAERVAREVMSNRASPRAYDGQFLLAQALAGEKQYAQAAIAFDDAYNRSHKGRHAEDALLGLAGALTAINEKKAACDTLGRLRNEFPEARADLRDSIARTSDRAGCAH